VFLCLPPPSSAAAARAVTGSARRTTAIAIAETTLRIRSMSDPSFAGLPGRPRSRSSPGTGEGEEGGLSGPGLIHLLGRRPVQALALFSQARSPLSVKLFVRRVDLCDRLAGERGLVERPHVLVGRLALERHVLRRSAEEREQRDEELIRVA